MPTILRLDGYRFFFFSNENNEPPHIHVEFGDKLAKYWLSLWNSHHPNGSAPMSWARSGDWSSYIEMNS
jgi:hypothetical protein